MDQQQPTPSNITEHPVVPEQTPVINTETPVKKESLAHKINRVTAIVLIISGSVFVLIAILAIWQVFGADNGDVVWRALGSLGAIALGALIVSVASKLIDDRSH